MKAQAGCAGLMTGTTGAVIRVRAGAGKICGLIATFFFGAGGGVNILSGLGAGVIFFDPI
jgi:hypothetical protein